MTIRHISTRLILIVFMSAALIAGSMGVFHYYFSRDAQIAGTAREMLSMGREKREAIGAWIEHSQVELTAISAVAQAHRLMREIITPPSDQARQDAVADFSNFIAPWIGEHGSFSSLWIVDAGTSDILFRSDGAAGLDRQGGQDSLWAPTLGTLARLDQATVNPVIFQTRFGSNIVITRPIGEPGVPPAAYLVARLGEADLIRIIHRDGSGAAGFDSYLVDASRQFIVAPIQAVEEVPINRAPWTEACLKARDGWHVGLNFRDVRVIAAHLWIPQFKGCLTTQLEWATALAPLEVLTRISAIFALAGLTLSVIVGWVMARRFATPITELARAAEQIRQGNPVELRPFVGKDEIGILWRAFADMFDALGRNANQISRNTRDLERRVEQRTRELVEAKALAESYLDMAGAVILALDAKAQVTMINRRGCEVLNRKEGEVLGRCWFDVCLPPDKATEVLIDYLDVMTGRRLPMPTMGGWIIDARGMSHMIDWSITYLRDVDGKIVGALCAGIDVTEQRSAAEALKISEQRLIASQRIANIGTWDWDITAGTLYWSTQIAALFGLEPADRVFSYDEFLDLVHPEDRVRVSRHLESRLRQGGECRLEHRIIHPDGSIHWLLEHGNISLGESGRPLRMLGIVQDITDRKKEEDTLRQVQKMEALGNLAGGVAHSLNNLLVPIINLSDVIRDEVPADGMEARSLKKINEAAQTARDLVSRILAFSRREPPRRKVRDSFELLENALLLTRTTIPATINLRAYLQPDAGKVVVDVTQVESVILNIINNAIFALADQTNARINIDLRQSRLDPGDGVEIAGLPVGPYVRITIADNGPGMSDEVRNRIFDPFFTTKDVGEGTGLGLSMAHGIMQEHGGAIAVDSAPGEGACFRLYLPLFEADDPIEDGEDEKGSGGRRDSEPMPQPISS